MRAKRKLDTLFAERGVWLLKVPNYLAETWGDCPSQHELGVISIRRWKKCKFKMWFISADERLRVCVKLVAK